MGRMLGLPLWIAAGLLLTAACEDKPTGTQRESLAQAPGLEEPAAGDPLADIHKQVAADAVAQYQIAAKHGSATDKCVQAGMVAAAFLQAKNEDEYKHWKDIEKEDCAAAGVPQ